MAFEQKAPQPYGILARGQKETEMAKFYDSPFMSSRKSSGIYIDMAEANFTSLETYLDGKFMTIRGADGITKTDPDFVRTADTQLNDNAGRTFVAYFDEVNDVCSIYIPYVLTGKEEDLARALTALTYKKADGTTLTLSRIDFKSSVKKA